MRVGALLSCWYIAESCSKIEQTVASDSSDGMTISKRLTVPLSNDGETLWKRLQRVRNLRVVAQSVVAGGWNGIGVGRVRVEEMVGNSLVYPESGQWTTPGGQYYPFRNVCRWRLPPLVSELRLEYLRGGIEYPVYLVWARGKLGVGFDPARPMPSG